MAKFSAAQPLDAFFDGLGEPHGKDVSIKCIEGQGMVQVFAANGKTSAVERALKVKEKPGQISSTSEYSAIPLSPGQWVLISTGKSSDGFADAISKKLKKNGYVSEQSDARVTFRISGKHARELMQKGCRLDLDSSVISAGWCAQTQMAQAGVILHLVDEKPTFDIHVYSGFAQHFAEWLEHTGAQSGISFKR